MTVDLLQATLKFSQGTSQRGWSHKKEGVTLDIWIGLENIYWLSEFAEHMKVL